MNIFLFRAWGIGILFAALGLCGCASLAPRGSIRPVTATAGEPMPGAFVNPLPGCRVISSFGPRGKRRHEGVDLRKSSGGGEVVVAARAGTVEKARRSNGYGLMVELLHPDGSRTRYAHLKKILVKEHQQVASGQELGLVGSTGNATGPHLHYEVLTALGCCVNPLPYLQTVAVAQGDRLTRQTAKAEPPAPAAESDDKSNGLPEEVKINRDFRAWDRKWENVDPSFSVNKFERIAGLSEDEYFPKDANSINATEALNEYHGTDRENELKIYSPDRTKFIWNAGYPDPLGIASDVLFFDSTANTCRKLLSFGPAFSAEKVFWIDNNKFMVIVMGEFDGSKGAGENARYYQHTLYLYDLEKNAIAKYLSPELVSGEKLRNSQTIQAAAANTGHRRNFSK